MYRSSSTSAPAEKGKYGHDDDISAAPGSARETSILVNGRTVELTESDRDGRALLERAGDRPSDDFALVQRFALGSRLISADERLDLSVGSPPRFFTFRSGEVFTFTVDCHSFQWGKPEISEPELRDFVQLAIDRVFVIVKSDGNEKVLRTDEHLNLRTSGAEHVLTEKRLVEVFYNGDKREIDAGTYTTEQLFTVFSVPAGYLLNLAVGQGLEPLKPGQKTHVKDGMRFFSQVPGGGSA